MSRISIVWRRGWIFKELDCRLIAALYFWGLRFSLQYRAASRLCRVFLFPGGRLPKIRTLDYQFKRNVEAVDFGTLLDMTPEERNRLHQLCAQIETETDHPKFLRLIQELNQLLEGKEGRLEQTTLPQDLGSAS